MRLLLDTGVLGEICHPRRHADTRAWFRAAATTHDLLVSELADYELRRELLRLGAVRSLARLDELVAAQALDEGAVVSRRTRSTFWRWGWARTPGLTSDPGVARARGHASGDEVHPTLDELPDS